MPANALSGKRSPGSDLAGRQQRPGSFRSRLFDIAEVAEWLRLGRDYHGQLGSSERLSLRNETLCTDDEEDQPR